MKVIVEYHGQMRATMGRPCEEIEVEEGCTVGRIMETRNLRGLIFVGAVQANEERVLEEGDVVILISPIAGGWE
jgi:molybdopterin converting factor small subunit